MKTTRLLGLIVVVGFMGALPIFALLDIRHSYEPEMLLFLLSVLVGGLIPLLVAWVAATTYLKHGSRTLLLMGGGMLVFGLGQVLGSWEISVARDPNAGVTIHNILSLLGALLHTVGALQALSGEPFRTNSRGSASVSALVYGGLALFAVLLTFLATKNILPPFFVPGTGATIVREVVLGGAVVFFVSASALFIGRYLTTPSGFVFWYALSLALIAVGLCSVFLQQAVGSPIGWLGRSAQYLGCLFALGAVNTARNEASAKGLSLESVMESFFSDAETQYRALVESAGDAIVAFDKDGRIIVWNPAAEEMFGYEENEVAGKDFYTTAIAREFRNVVERRVAGRENGPLDIHAQRKTGELFPASIACSSRPRDDNRVTTCIIRDITEAKASEAKLRAFQENLELLVAARTEELSREIDEHKRTAFKLRQSEQKLRSVFENSIDGILFTSPDQGLILAANPAACDMLETPPESLTEFAKERLLDSRDPAVAGFLEQRARTGSAVVETEFRRSDDTTLFLEIAGTIFEDVDGATRSVLVLRDISGRKQLEREREKLIEELQTKNTELERFAYTVSHDLRAPLITIQSFVGIIMKELDAGNIEQPLADLKRVYAAAQKMQELLQGLLELSRVGRMINPPVSVPFKDVVDEALLALQGLIKAAGASVHVSDDLPVVVVDKVRMVQVIQNLVENAIKFCGDGDSPHVEIGCVREDGEDVLFVKDHGIGIDPDYRERVFELFTRLDPSASGIGLGLALVKKIVELHGGEIRVESNPNESGSIFFFSLPQSSGR